MEHVVLHEPLGNTSDVVRLKVQLSHGRVRTLDQLIHGWVAHISRISQEMAGPSTPSGWGAHDYFAALTIRSFIQSAADSLEVTGQHEVDQLIAKADLLLRDITELDIRGLVRRFGDSAPTSAHWWWQRIPVAGLIREEFEAWLARAGN